MCIENNNYYLTARVVSRFSPPRFLTINIRLHFRVKWGHAHWQLPIIRSFVRFDIGSMCTLCQFVKLETKISGNGVQWSRYTLTSLYQWFRNESYFLINIRFLAINIGFQPWSNTITNINVYNHINLDLFRNSIVSCQCLSRLSLIAILDAWLQFSLRVQFANGTRWKFTAFVLFIHCLLIIE